MLCRAVLTVSVVINTEYLSGLLSLRVFGRHCERRPVSSRFFIVRRILSIKLGNGISVATIFPVRNVS